MILSKKLVVHDFQYVVLVLQRKFLDNILDSCMKNFDKNYRKQFSEITNR